MGCPSSKRADVVSKESDVRVELDFLEDEESDGSPGDRRSEASSRKASSRKSRGSNSVGDTSSFDAWHRMEQAVEDEYLAEEQYDTAIDDLLAQRHPHRGSLKALPILESTKMWQDMAVGIDYEDGFFIGEPFTLKKANELARYLRRPDANPIPRRCVYEVLIAACEQLEAQARTSGAVQIVPPPQKKSDKLFVCGDTHGQLQDVLWIFQEHGNPAPGNAYLFNGDIADRGSNATEIFILLLAYKLAAPEVIFVNRGNHEQRDLNERPFANGGGFAWEVRSKYPHDERLIDLFQRFFCLMPVASLIGSWALVIHGGLFRDPDVNIEDIKTIDSRRQPPTNLTSRDDRLLFDALWADPHNDDGVIMSNNRGGYSIQFGRDVTKSFCERNKVQSVIRSHQLPKKMRGYEIQHDAMLLTIFSASNYGGVCRNRGGVLIFDDKGPAEVKEFYAPPLDRFRDMCTENLLDSSRTGLQHWYAAAKLGEIGRRQRQETRSAIQSANESWFQLLYKFDAQGRLLQRTKEIEEALKNYEAEQQLNPVNAKCSAMPEGDSCRSSSISSRTQSSTLSNKKSQRISERISVSKRLSDRISGKRLSDRKSDRKSDRNSNRFPGSGPIQERRTISSVCYSTTMGSGIEGFTAGGTTKGFSSSKYSSIKVGPRHSTGAAVPVKIAAELAEELKNGSGKVKRHSLAIAPLRPGGLDSEKLRSENYSVKTTKTPRGNNAASSTKTDASSSKSSSTDATDNEWQPGERHVAGVVYCIEESSSEQTSVDIMKAMQLQIARFKGPLTSALVKAEQGSGRKSDGLATGISEKLSPRAISYKIRTDQTRHVLPYAIWEQVIAKQFPEFGHLWKTYAPRLLGTWTTDRRELLSQRVHYKLWLDRFQIKLKCGRFLDFQHEILQQLYDSLLKNTKEMTMSELLSYFDPDNDEQVRQKDVLQVLSALELDLSEKQLQQLVIELGFTDSVEPVHPVQVICTLLAAVAPAVKQIGMPKKSSDPRLSLQRNSSSFRRASNLDLLAVVRLREMLELNKLRVKESFEGGSLKAIFEKADADTDGFLSYDEAGKVLVELQEVCGQLIIDSEEQLENVVTFIDLAKTGRVSFLEFLAALGLPEVGEADEEGELDEDTRAEHFVLRIMQQILSMLFERSHAMLKAFRHLDDNGEGWLSEQDFEEALRLVLIHGIQNPLLLGKQVKALVRSLRGSELTDEQNRFAYCDFIQAFEVIAVESTMSVVSMESSRPVASSQ